mgnify:CR=1 FL=1
MSCVRLGIGLTEIYSMRGEWEIVDCVRRYAGGGISDHRLLERGERSFVWIGAKCSTRSRLASCVGNPLLVLKSSSSNHFLLQSYFWLTTSIRGRRLDVVFPPRRDDSRCQMTRPGGERICNNSYLLLIKQKRYIIREEGKARGLAEVKVKWFQIHLESKDSVKQVLRLLGT